jgi:hypothetical protein
MSGIPRRFLELPNAFTDAVHKLTNGAHNEFPSPPRAPG